MITNILLYNIITRKQSTCCICFKAIEGITTNIEDEIVLEEKDPKSTIKMQDILSHILGYETVNNITFFETLCQQCTYAAINCYKFIMMSRNNSEELNNAINSLYESVCLENIPESENKNKTLFITIDSSNFTAQNYYDHKFVSSRSIALKRLQRITDVKSSIKKETIIKQEEELENYKTNKSKKRRKYFSVPIKTSEMIHDKSDRTTFQCKACLKSFFSLPSLRNHYIRMHAPKDYECSICHRKFGSIAILDGHKKESHCTVVCSECGKTFHNRHTFKMHKIGHHYKYVCQVCGRVYKSQSTFKKHIDLNVCSQKTRASPADAKFTCDYCNKKYTQKVSLRVHIQYEHGNYKGHECKWCKKTFYAQSRLKAHIVKHTQEKNFPCSMCGGKFTSKESLLYHTRIHTGERPYKCDFCDNRFLSASRRSEHTKRCHAKHKLSQNNQAEIENFDRKYYLHT